MGRIVRRIGSLLVVALVVFAVALAAGLLLSLPGMWYLSTVGINVGRMGGVAVAGVLGGTCGGCHSSLPPQLVNEVKKRDRLHHCEFCGRFLVHDPALDA